MSTQLFFNLTAVQPCRSVHFRESQEVEVVLEELRRQNIAVFEIDGAALTTPEEMFKAFAIALRMPKGWYGDEEYAPNADAFHEYLDDVVKWVPARGHVVLIRRSETLWRTRGRLAGDLVEWWQFATIHRQANIHLVFVW